MAYTGEDLEADGQRLPVQDEPAVRELIPYLESFGISLLPQESTEEDGVGGDGRTKRLGLGSGVLEQPNECVRCDLAVVRGGNEGGGPIEDVDGLLVHVPEGGGTGDRGLGGRAVVMGPAVEGEEIVEIVEGRGAIVVHGPEIKGVGGMGDTLGRPAGRWGQGVLYAIVVDGGEIVIGLVDGAVVREDPQVGLEMVCGGDDAFVDHAGTEILCELKGDEAVGDESAIGVGREGDLAGGHGLQDGEGLFCDLVGRGKEGKGAEEHVEVEGREVDGVEEEELDETVQGRDEAKVGERVGGEGEQMGSVAGVEGVEVAEGESEEGMLGIGVRPDRATGQREEDPGWDGLAGEGVESAGEGRGGEHGPPSGELLARDPAVVLPAQRGKQEPDGVLCRGEGSLCVRGRLSAETEDGERGGGGPPGQHERGERDQEGAGCKQGHTDTAFHPPLFFVRRSLSLSLLRTTSSSSSPSMPRILFVSGFHPSTRARDLAYEFERWVPRSSLCPVVDRRPSYGPLVRCDVPAPRNPHASSNP